MAYAFLAMEAEEKAHERAVKRLIRASAKLTALDVEMLALQAESWAKVVQRG